MDDNNFQLKKFNREDTLLLYAFMLSVPLEGSKLTTSLKVRFLNTLARIAHQVVSVCAWLTNFQPALVPSQQDYEEVEDEVDKYFETYNDELTSNSSDSEDSVNEDI